MLLANSENSSKPEFFDLLQCGSELELFLIMMVVGQHQDVLAPLVGEFGRQDQEVRTNGIQRGVEILLGQAEPLEPMHQVETTWFASGRGGPPVDE